MSDYGSTPPPPPPPPGGGYGAPPPMGGMGTPPGNNLVLAIVSLLCCWPLGIPAIVFAAKVNGKWNAGDQAGALDSADKAKKFAIASIALGAVMLVLYIIAIAAGVATSNTEAEPPMTSVSTDASSTDPQTLQRPAPSPAPIAGRGRRMLYPSLSAAGTLVFLTVVQVIDPNEPGHFPTCPWLALTGTYCPGCGTMRATHALTHGHLGEALARNPVTVISYVAILIGYVNWTQRQWRGKQKTTLAPAWMLYLLFAGIMAYWVLRNMPGWTWLSPE